MHTRFCQAFSLNKIALISLALIVFSLCLAPYTFSSEEGNIEDKLNDDLFAVSFPNERDGWVCGRWGSIFYTSDGGNVWTRQESGTAYTLTSICFVDKNNGWAVGDKGTIIHTKNGGKTWVKQKCPEPLILMDVYFVNAQKGWIVTEWTKILHTEDGGKTWKVQFGDEDFILKSVSFCDEKHGWAVGEYGFIYHTTDGGKTWQKEAGEFGFSEETGDIIAGNYLFDVNTVDPKTAWVTGIDGYLAVTTDGGAKWKEVEWKLPRTQLFSVLATGEGTVLIGGKATLLTSIDNGETFKMPSIEPHIKYSWIYGIARRGKSGFVAVGKQGSIYMAGPEAMSWRLAASK